MRSLKIVKEITDRDEGHLNKYLQEIGREDLIDADKEIELAQKIKQGDVMALEKLTKANLRFVISVAKQYQNKGLPLPDLINEGNLGLIKAAKRFDETRGFKFISYAVWWIRQSILLALAEQSRTVGIPLNQVGNINNLNQGIDKLEQKLERIPTPEEIADFMNLSEEKVNETTEISQKQTSLDIPLSDTNEEFTLANLLTSDTPPPDSTLEMESLKKDILRVFETGLINPNSKIALNLRFGLEGSHPHTLFEIAQILTKKNGKPRTEESVRQTIVRALLKIKDSSAAKKLLRKHL